MRENYFGKSVAERYDETSAAMFTPEVLDPAVDFLAELAGDGPVLELAIGTGRLALPLSRRGIAVHGIELSPAMAARLETGPLVSVTLGDFATTTLGRAFRLAYLARNTITNLTTQDEQVACFRNVAAHLEPGGVFVVENYIPALRRIPPGETTRVFTRTPDHLGFEEYDLAEQIAISHHYWVIDGELKTMSSPHRYLWPAELDLMARIAGMTLRERWAGWRRTPFTGDSESHVSVWRKSA